MRTLLSSIGVVYLDHYAITTKNLNATTADLLNVPGAKLLRGPGTNPAQKVNYAFVEMNGMGVIEVLSPQDESSPILNHLSKGGGAYHMCYAVKDLDKALHIAQSEFNAKKIVDAKSDGAFDGRRVAFLVHPNHGLFELLEAKPQLNMNYNNAVEIKETNEPLYRDNSNLDNKLVHIFNEVMNTSARSIIDITMQTEPRWDSLKHLMLIMEIESHFEINITASQMSEFTTLQAIRDYIAAI